METEKKTIQIPEERSVIVVSDLHLGGPEDKETISRLYHFLDLLQKGNVPVSSLPGMGHTAGSPDSCPKNLLQPEKIILLGDILDLWDSRRQDRNNAFLDALILFLKLREIDCDVVYVTGNHDEDMGEVLTTVKEAKGDKPTLWKQVFTLFYGGEGSQKVLESLKIAWNGDRILEISPRHYPATTTGGPVQGLDAGGVRYAFIHGQQFDKEQITATISKAIGHRLDVVDFFQDLASCSAMRYMSAGFSVGCIIAFIILAWLFVSPPVFPYSYAVWIIGAATGMGIAWVLLKGIHLFGIAQKTLPSSRLLFRICMVLFIAELAALLAGCYTLSMTVYAYLFNIILFVTLYCVLVIAIPVIFARIKKTVYNLKWNVKKSESKDIYSSVLSGTKYSYNAEVLVFGHTHVPGYFLNTQDKKEKPDRSSAGKPALLINAGTWVGEENIIDSFIYIDRTGVALMQWKEDTGIVCLNHFPANIILSRAGELRTLSRQTA